MNEYLKLTSPINNKEIFLQNILIFVAISIAYIFFICPLFHHSIFPFLFSFSLSKLFLSLGILFLFNGFVFFIKNSFIKTIWFYVFNLQLQGALVYFTFAPEISFSIVLQNLILLLIIFVSDKIFVNLNNLPSINLEKSYNYILIISVVLISPFLITYGKYITLDNLMFKDIYKTRIIFREINIPILNYLISPLSRVLLPALLVISIYKRKYLYALLTFIGITYLFLCGATKSILVGAITAVFFYPGKSWEIKTRYFTHLIIGLFSIGFLSIVLFDNNFIYDAFIRRVFFVPPYLDNMYHQFFTNNFTYWKHSSLALGSSKLELLNGQDLTLFFGEKVMNKVGMNANIGIITEGYISYGYIGVLIHSVFYAGLFLYIRFINISSIFFGILFSYLFYLNTSLVSTLFLTHGLFFLLFFLTVFLKDSNSKFNNRPW